MNGAVNNLSIRKMQFNNLTSWAELGQAQLKLELGTITISIYIIYGSIQTKIVQGVIQVVS